MSNALGARMLLVLLSCCRSHPFLPGRPTTVHSPVRQALALGIRLGCPMIEITFMLIAHGCLNGGQTSSQERPWLRFYQLSKASGVWLGTAVHACSSCAVSGVPLLIGHACTDGQLSTATEPHTGAHDAGL
jgi:hypothetical protein